MLTCLLVVAALLALGGPSGDGGVEGINLVTERRGSSSSSDFDKALQRAVQEVLHNPDEEFDKALQRAVQEVLHNPDEGSRRKSRSRSSSSADPTDFDKALRRAVQEVLHNPDEGSRRKSRSRSSRSDTPSSEREISEGATVCAPQEKVKVESEDLRNSGKIVFAVRGEVKKVTESGKDLRVKLKSGFLYSHPIGRDFEIVSKSWDRTARRLEVTVRFT